MKSNTFLTDPVKVVIFDPIKEINRHTYVFLGDIPKSVSSACQYYRSSTAPQDKHLQEHYGADYKSKLGLNIKDPRHGWVPKFDRRLPTGAGISRYTEAGSFTHGKYRYDLDCALEAVAGQPIINVPISELVWVLNDMPKGYFDDPAERARVDTCDITTPILITRGTEWGTVVLDGIHRLKRAVDLYSERNINNQPAQDMYLPAREIGTTDLAKCLLSRPTDYQLAPAELDADSEIGSTMGSGDLDTPTSTPFVGAAPNISGDVDYSDIEELLNAPMVPTAQSAHQLPTYTEFEPGIEYVTAVHVFPEDKFSDLKEKIYIVSDIPAYRQHLFYFDHNLLRTTYQIHAEGAYDADITNLSRSHDNIHGIPIDKMLYDLRDSIRVEALDTFRILGETAPDNNVIYVVDLAQFIYKLRTQILDLVNDTYQFELFYFGFIIKYWPQLTQECFYDFIISEQELQHKYPDLAKNKTTLTQIYRAERDIVTFNYRNMTKALSNPAISLAITQMIALVANPGIVLNIRNLFDKLRVTRCIPEIHAYISYNNKKYMLRKRHIQNGSSIQFPAGTLMKTGITIAISLRKADQESFHSRSTTSIMENEQSRYLFINIRPNGAYYIKTIWNEEDEYSFDDILKLMKKFTDPIIGGINNLGKYVFMSGRSLAPISRSNISYQSLNICVFWKKIMLESTFKLVRSLWDSYMRARITGPRNVQQFDKYEFLFRKGMHEFDAVIDKIITASSNIMLANYYAYLSNNSVKQKWDQNYDGRIVRMSHRTTDVRFEIVDIREREFQIFHHYIAAYIYRASNDDKIHASLENAKVYKDVKKLKKLREQDPELFNLKKHGSTKVYSKICQNKRQPLIYTQDEVKGLPSAELKQLTEYWNFTMNKPTYYGCPNKKYPHLSFIVGVHPKHYCLPCCGGSMQAEDESKKSRINAICLRKHKFAEADAAQDNGLGGAQSRHIMGYNKDIDIGRLAKLPQSAIKNLLFDTLNQSGNSAAKCGMSKADISKGDTSEGDELKNDTSGGKSPKGKNLDYYLYGVAQHVPGANHVGVIYAIAAAINEPLSVLARRLLAELRRQTTHKLFDMLLGGTLAEYFHSINDLADTINDLFVEMKTFSREIQKFTQWPELFIELFYILFHIPIFVFIDERGDGHTVDLFVPDMLRNEIVYIMKLTGDDSHNYSANRALADNLRSTNYIFLLKKRNQYYPIFIIDINTYFKNLKVAVRQFTVDDKIVQLAFDMIKYNEQRHTLHIGKPVDLSMLKLFVAPPYTVSLKFINHQNLCYAVMIEGGPGPIYMPLDYSAHVDDKIPISFDVFDRKKYKLAHSDLRKFIDKLNAYIKEKYSIAGTQLYSYKLIEPTEYFSINERVAGFRAVNMMFYFTEYDKTELDTRIPIHKLMYDYTEVNQKINERAAPVSDPRSLRIGEALYNNYLYQLFVIEFVNYLNNERNLPLRKQLTSLITSTNFKKDISVFRKSLHKLLQDYPEDLKTIQNQLISFYYTHFDKTVLIGEIDTFVYDFDRITMNKLRRLTKEQLYTELRQIADTFSVRADIDTTNIQLTNVYVPCADAGDVGHCTRGKLIVNRPVDDFIDILAADLTNDLKSKYLLNTFTDVVIDWLQFTQHPTEIITIYRLTE